MEVGDGVRRTALAAEQHFTRPPPRYTEASLVKALEEHGIGRPSTYASIISTLQDREYVEMDSKRFVPTDIGKIVGRFLTQHFHRYVEYGFTAAMEDELDAVSRGEEEWTTPLDKFWKPFIQQVEKIERTVTREQVAQARELGKDPATGKPIAVRMGRFGPFVQIGTKDDEEKPRFAGLRPGQKMDLITLADAMELFKLPRTLGETPEGETIVANVGRFGPYVKYGSKYASLKEDDPYTVTLERALEVIRLKKEADANRIIQDFAEAGIQVLNGRYGPYITDKKKNAKIPKDRDPKMLTLEECRATLRLIEERGVTAVGRGERPEVRLLALHALEGRDAQDVGGGAADGEDRCPEALPQRPQIRRHGLPVLQRLADQRIGVDLEEPRGVGAVAQAHDLFPAGVGEPRPRRAVEGAHLRGGLRPALHGCRLARIAADPRKARRVDLGAHVVEHDARHERRLRGREHHRHEPAHGGADDRDARDAEPREQRPNILQVHRNRVVVEVPVAVREAPATDIRRDDPVARRQVRRQVAEIAAVAHQAVQAEHHRRVRRGTRVHPAEEPEAIVAVVPVLGHRAAPLLAPAVPGAALVYIPAVG